MERVSGEARGKQQYYPGLSDLLFGTISWNLNGLWLHVKDLWVEERAGGDKGERECVPGSVFFDNFSSRMAKAIWSPHDAQGLQGDSWMQRCIKITFLWDENHDY